MATDTSHFFFDLFQEANSTVEWLWELRDVTHHWNISYRPMQANSNCEIVRHFVVTDNNLNPTDHIFTRTSTGNTFRMSAIRVSGT